jgi:hypothetical protein
MEAAPHSRVGACAWREEYSEQPPILTIFVNTFEAAMALNTKQAERDRKKILSYGGSFSDVSKKDYADFIRQTKKTRDELLTR